MSIIICQTRKPNVSKCGTEILVATANRTGGFCMPCKQGPGIRGIKEYSQAMEDLEAGRNIEQALHRIYGNVKPELVEYYKTETERKRTQTGELDLPVFGKLVRTPDELMMFREFPYLRLFGKPDHRAQDGKPFIEHLDKNERKLVENWKTPSVQLVAICRNGVIYTSLRNLGVFEVGVSVADDGLPSASQQKAYEGFMADEKAICGAIVDALMRYYQYARKEMPDWFDYLDDEEKPANPTILQFSKLIELDGMTVCRGSAKGVSPLLFGWGPIWDEEHGLSILVYRGQVIAMGPDASDLLDADPKSALKHIEDYGWGRKQMNPEELSALEEFVSSYEHVPQDED